MPDKERLSEYEQNVSPIFDTLLTPNSLWHRMSLQAFRSVVNDGYILPCGSGPEHTYEGASKVSVAFRIGAVSLFEFESARRDWVLEQSINWLQFMVDQGNPTLVLRLDKSDFKNGELVTQDDLTRENRWPMLTLEEYSEMPAYFIPYVESWHIGKIASNKIRDVLVVSNQRTKDFQLISYSDALKKLENEWPQSSIKLESWSPGMLEAIAKFTSGAD